MIIALGNRHRLVAGGVVDLLDWDAEVEQQRDKVVSYLQSFALLTIQK